LLFFSSCFHRIQLRNSAIFPANESAVASTVSDKGGESVTDTVDFPVALDDDDHQVIMDDDDDDSNLARRRRSLYLSEQNSEGNHNDIGISFDASIEDRDHAPEAAIRRPPRKRRKIVTDDGRTELSNDHIRAMLADTSDICRGNDDGEMLHPVTWMGRTPSAILGAAEDDLVRRNRRLLWTSLNPPERLFCRPSLADDGYMSSELIELWSRNCGPILSLPFRYELKIDEENEKVDEEEEEQEIEEARLDQDASNHHDESEDNPFPQPDDAGFDPSLDNDDNNAIPFADEDERMPAYDDVIPSDSTFARYLSFHRPGWSKSAID
jgi:hypothetical protein